MSDYALKQASEVRRGDFISIDGNWLEVIRVNPTGHPEDVESIRSPKSLQFLFLNGRSMIVRPDEEFMVLA